MVLEISIYPQTKVICGHVPCATEPVQISSGHTITLDVNGAAKSLDLRGILNKQATKILLIQGN